MSVVVKTTRIPISGFSDTVFETVEIDISEKLIPSKNQISARPASLAALSPLCGVANFFFHSTHHSCHNHNSNN
jgi:hypothetical protein